MEVSHAQSHMQKSIHQMLYLHLQGSDSGNENKPTQTPKSCKGSICPLSRPRSHPSGCPGRGASPWCWNIPPPPARPDPAGRWLAFPKKKVHFQEEKTTSSLSARIFTDEEKKYLQNSTAVLFLMRKRQPILTLAGKGLKIAVTSSSERTSFFKATKNLQDSVRC